MFRYKYTVNLLTKVLVVGVVLSLMPTISSVVVPEYEGFNLEAADDKKKRTRKRVKLPSKKAQKILQAVQPFMEEEQWPEAIEILLVIETDPKFTETDRASMLFYLSLIHISEPTRPY